MPPQPNADAPLPGDIVLRPEAGNGAVSLREAPHPPQLLASTESEAFETARTFALAERVDVWMERNSGCVLVESYRPRGAAERPASSAQPSAMAASGEGFRSLPNLPASVVRHK